MFSVNDECTIGGAKGFQIEFPNRHTVSVIWGRGSSSDKDTAEVAIFKPDGSFYPLGGQNTWAWRTPKDVAQLVFFASML